MDSEYKSTINVITFVFNFCTVHYCDDDSWVCYADIVSRVFTWIRALDCVTFQNGKHIENAHGKGDG